VSDVAKYTKELTKLLSSSDNILLVCHINPDGDAVGSQLALYHYLISLGRHVEMMSPNNLQEFLKWMTGSDLIHIFIREREKCRKLIGESDLIIMLDFNQPDRLGEAQDFVLASKARKIIIDHHQAPPVFEGLLISDIGKCATSEIIYDLVTAINGGPFINLPYAEALYTGIVTDTGNFEHGTYSPRTFRIVADLLESGIDKVWVLDQIYNNFSSDRMKLMGFALNERMTIIPEFKTAYIYLTRKDLSGFNYMKGDTEGFVNLPLSIKGIVFSVLFIEKEGFIKLSFRSKGTFPVHEFASRYFSGGGHMNASGGEYPGSLVDTIEYFKKVLADSFEVFNKKY
jgi:bifunctional oligoribonuclease and PAP phosphatase NrnA